MAYTYDDFVTAANKAGLMGQFSQYDLETARKSPEFGLSILRLKQDAANATTAEQRLLANEAANQLRKTYGNYSGGSDGSGYEYAENYRSQINDLIGKANGYGSFTYDRESDYQKLLDSIVNQQPFSYDMETDPSYGAYKKAYLREGDRASANALAQASAASGGRTSSYATTAAQQAGNYYAGQLGDLIPTLEQNAYQRYLNDFSSKLSSLGALDTDKAFDYEDYLNQYNLLRSSLGMVQQQDETDYARYLDAYNRAYQQQQDAETAKQQEFQNALALYQAMGYATPGVANILGIDSGDADGYSGGISGSSTSGGSSGTVTDSASISPSLGETTAGIPENVLSALKNAYPTGKVDSETVWNSMVSQYGESVLNAAGFNHGDETTDKDTSNFAVTNRNGNGWIAVDGHRLTYQELYKKVEQGEIIEKVDYDSGTITYTYAKGGSGKESSGGSGGNVGNKNTVNMLN